MACAAVLAAALALTTPALAGDSEAAGPSLLSAFFGLDNALPAQANLICRGAPGRDGMPVIFSREVDPAALDSKYFAVATQAGAQGSVHCVSLLPATDAGELRTVLVVGEFGDADADPPATVRIVGEVRSLDGAVSFAGAQVDVTPLDAGPSMIMAEPVDPDAREEGLGDRRTAGSACPAEGIVQAVRVVWAGGVTRPNGGDAGEPERARYRVSVRSADGAQRTVAPAALADLGDGDNNHVLCLDTADAPFAVSLPAGVLADPNGDTNPATAVAVVPAP